MASVVALWFLLASGLAFGVYAWDKWAAVRGARRVPERVLHTLGLVGGWPGAWLAQQRLRHKTSKPAFLRMFWLTVACNLVATVAVILAATGAARAFASA